MQPNLILAVVSLTLLIELHAIPLSLFKSSEKQQPSSWFDLFAPDNDIDDDEEPLEPYQMEDDDQYQDQIWSDCSSSPRLVDLESVSISPSPPQRGESFTVSAKVALSNQISSGSVKLLINWKKYIPVISKTMSLCELVEYLGESCPLSAGIHKASYTGTFSSYAPSGRYTGNVTAKDSYGNSLLCIAIDMTI